MHLFGRDSLVFDTLVELIYHSLADVYSDDALRVWGQLSRNQAWGKSWRRLSLFDSVLPTCPTRIFHESGRVFVEIICVDQCSSDPSIPY